MRPTTHHTRRSRRRDRSVGLGRRVTSAWRSASVRERGTVLLMVIGVLALLAIIAVAYAALGRSDRASSAALVRDQRLNDQASDVMEYLAGVIAGDLFSTYTERNLNNQSPLRREVSDYSGCDPQMVSTNALVTGTPPADRPQTYAFDPRGSYSTAPRDPNVQDLRQPSDPWLASIEPTLFRAPAPAVFTLQSVRAYTDLSNTSIFSPDGRVVNLANLRGNFGAEPGFGLDGSNRPRMSERLTLMDITTNPADPRPYPAAAAVGGNGPRITLSRREDALAAVAEYPYDWSSRQAAAFRPMIDDPNWQIQLGDPRSVGNQWCDTDGDGFADTRWQELIDARDPINPVSAIPMHGRARLFFAARCIDLSGLINVNTAGDFFYEPGLSPAVRPPTPEPFPAGLTPTDVDLRRVLMMTDSYLQFSQAAADSPPFNVYDLLPQPQDAQAAASYTQYTRATAADMGKVAYSSLRWSMENGTVLDPAVAGLAHPILIQNPSEVVPNVLNPNPLNERQRATYYDDFGADPSSARALSPTLRAFKGPFGLPDELELRSFNGVNDSSHLSRLEECVGGRLGEDSTGPGGDVRRFSPLRDNRERGLEMRWRDRYETNANLISRGLLSTMVDVRHLITTISGARPLVDRVVPSENEPLGAADLSADGAAYVAKCRLPKNVPGRITVADKIELFKIVCDALLPYTDFSQYPSAWNRATPQVQQLHYGRDAELAYRLAAHWVANFVDSIDMDTTDPAGFGDRHEPTVFALEVSQSPVPRPAPDVLSPDVVTLSNRRVAANNGDLISSTRVNIYGVEPQPFIAETAVFAIYVDTPTDAGGDDEYGMRTPNPMPGGPDVLVPITINGDMNDINNTDFIGEIIAFQLTNPFDTDIVLTPAGGMDYYIEFAGKFYQLVLQEDRPNQVVISSNELKLPAGKTKVFYSISPRTVSEFEDRIRAAGNSASHPVDPAIAAGYVDRWARAQFTVGGAEAPVKIPQIDIVSGMPTGHTGFADLRGFDSGASAAERKVVHLWRVRRESLLENPTSNLQANDQLVDRLRDPSLTSAGEGALGMRASQSNIDIAGTEAGEEDSATPEENTGYSIMSWAALRRPTNPGDPNFDSPRGAFPAWALEAKSEAAPGYAASLNQALVGIDPDFGTGGSWAGSDTFQDLLEDYTITGTLLNDQLRKTAENKRGWQIDSGARQSQSYLANGTRKVFRDVAIELHRSDHDRNQQLYGRIGDFLLPLCIGSSFDPTRAASTLPNIGGRIAELESRWMTLGESLALATDYWSPPAPTSGAPNNTEPDRLFYRLGHDNPAALLKPKLDRGNLVINDFVPFVDRSAPGGSFDSTTDEPLNRGIPLALNLLEAFRTTDTLPGQARRQSPGSLTKAVIGKINANTAPRAVLRAVPMLTPDSDPAAWVRTGTDALYPVTATTETWDVASTLVAYRDQISILTRPATRGGVPKRINFRPDVLPPKWGRAFTTSIDGLRQGLGLKSLGELLVLNVDPIPGAGYDPVSDTSIDNSILRLGRDTLANRAKGLESSNYDTTPGTWFPNTIDTLRDDYDEKLAIATAAMNSLSVRSDFFCVWFVIRGYLPEDVEGLSSVQGQPGFNEPMSPSIERRYVMVVDRSNVIRPSDKPRILLFQELPLN